MMPENEEKNAVIDAVTSVFGIDSSKISTEVEYGDFNYVYLNEGNTKKYIFHFYFSNTQIRQITIYFDKYLNYHFKNLTELNKESAQSVIKYLREKFGIVDEDISIYAYPTEGWDDRLAIDRVKKVKKRKK